MLNHTQTSNTSHPRTVSSDAPEVVEQLSSIVEARSTPALMAGYLLDTVRVMRAEEDLERRLVEEGLTDSAKVRRIALPTDRGEFIRFVREWEQKHRRAVTAGTIATLVLPLAACGGGGGGGYRPDDGGDSGGGDSGGSGGGGGGDLPLVTTDGYVIDGYVSGANVTRENGSGNTVTTDATGRFTKLTGTGPMVATGGIDIVTGQPVGFTMRAPEGATLISPLTTLVQALVDGGATSAAAYDTVAAKLGLTVAQLQSDPWATAGAEDLEAIQSAVQVANLLRAAVTEGADAKLAAKALVNTLTSANDLFNQGKLESFFADPTLKIANAKTLAETLAQTNAEVAGATTVDELEQAQSLPTVTISLSTTVKAGESTTVTFTFSEAPQGFDLADIQAENGTLSNLQVKADSGGLVYTATYTAAAGVTDTTNLITVGTDWTDSQGNKPAAATSSTNFQIEPVTPPTPGGGGDSGSDPGPDIVPPTFSSGTTANVEENVPVNTVVYTAAAADVPASSITYSLKAVGDAAAFTIDSATGAVKIKASPDFETKPSYSFTVVATDAAGNSREQAVTLSVNNLDEVAPTFSSPATASVAENVAATTLVHTATAEDTDFNGPATANSITYSLKAVGDAAAFTIDSATGAVRIKAGPDFETKPSYSFTVIATDAAGNATEQAVVLAVTDVNEAPTAVTLLNATPSLPDGTVTTNRIKLADILVSDDAPGTNTVSLTGKDAGSFEVEGGVLYLKKAVTIDFDAQASYEASVSVQDSGVVGSDPVTTDYTLTISNDADNTPPDAPVVALANDTGSSAIDKVTSDGRLSVTGETSATVEYSTDSGVNWTTTFTPVEGANTVWVRQTDPSGNPSDPTSFTFTLDKIAPTVTIASSDTGTANIANGTLTYTFTFSEAVSGFTIDDVDVENGEKGFFTQVDASTYQLEVTPDAGLQGSMTLKVAAGVAADAAFNASAAATDYVQAVDTLAPTLRITDDELGEVANAAGGDIVFSFRFSEVVSGFAIEDVHIVGGTASGALTEATGADAGKLFTLVVTPTANFEGNLTVSVAQGAVSDLNGNPLSAEVSATQAVDTRAPSTPSINVVAGNDFIVASEKTAGVSLSGTAEADTEVLLTLGAGNVRTVTANESGVWTYELVADDYSAMGEGAETVRAIARDAAGNQSAETTRALGIDTVVPTLTITLGNSALTLGQSTLVTFQFSEAPLNFTAADISLGSTSVVLENLKVDGQDATKYTATLRASKNQADAESVIQVGTDWTDAAGNAPAAATSSANYKVTAVHPIVVNASGGGTFTTLQAAVDASVAGNDIRVDAGSFNASAYLQASTDALKALNSLTLASGVSLTLSAAQASGESIVAQGTANVVLNGLQLGTTAANGPIYDFTGITIGTGALNATVSTTGVLNAASTLGALALGVENGQTLTLSAAQASGRSITGLGSAVVTDLALTPAANFSGLLLSSATAAVDGPLTFTGTLGSVAVTVNSGVFTTSAAIASGKTIVGAGSVALTSLEATPAADLSKITASNVTAALLTSAGTPVSFNGNAGKAVVSVTGDGELQLAPTATLGSGALALGGGTTLSATATQLTEKTVTGTGTVNVDALAAGTNLAGLAEGLTVIASVGASINISANVNLGSVDSFVVAAGQTLTMSAAQADDATVSGGGAVVVTALGADTNLAGVSPAGGSTVKIAADLTFMGDLGSTDVSVATGVTFSTSVSIASGKTIDGAGTVALTGLEDALAADLSGIAAATLDVTATTSTTHSFTGSLGKAAVTVAGSGTLALGATADLGTATFTVELGATLRGSAQQLEGVAIDGTGTVEVLALGAGSDLSSIAPATSVVAYVESSLDITANVNLGSVDRYEVGAGQTLTLTAAQADGKSITGDGSVVITDLDTTPAADLDGLTASGGVTIPVDTTMNFTGTLSANAALTVEAGVQLTMDATLVNAHAVSGAGELKVSGSIATTDFTGVSTQSVDLTAATLDGRTDLSLNDTSQFVITPGQTAELSIAGTTGANTLVVDVSGLDFSGSPPEVTVVVSTGEGADRVQFRFGEGADTRTVKLSAESSITMGGGTDILESANGKLDISAADIDFSTIDTLEINSTIVLSADQLQLLLNVLGGQLGGLVGGGVIEVVGNLTSGTIDLNKFGSFTPGGLTPPTIRFPEGYTDDPAKQNNFTAPPAGSTVIIQIANGTGGYDTYGAFDGSGFTPTAVTVFTEAQLVAAAESATVQTIALGKAITLNTGIDLSDTTVALVTAADKQLTLGSSGSVTMTATQANGADIAGTGSVTVVAGAGVSTLDGLDFSGILAPATLQVTGTLDARGAGLGQFAVDVASGGVLTLEATQVAGRLVSGTGQLVLLNADAAPAANYANLASGLTVTAEFDGSASFTGNFGGVDQVLVSGTDTVLTVGAGAISGRTVTGNGAVTVNSLTTSADLSGVAVTGTKLANVGTNLSFSGKFGYFDVVVAASRTLTTTADKLNGVEVSGAGRVSLTNLVEGADLSGLDNTGGKLATVSADTTFSSGRLASGFTVTVVGSDTTLTTTPEALSGARVLGTGEVVLSGVESGDDLSNILVTGAKQVLVAQSADFTNVNLGAFSVEVADAAVLTLSAAQTSARLISGAGGVTVTALGAATDLSGVSATGSKIATVASDLVFTGNLGSFALGIAESATLTASAARLDGKVIAGAGNIVVTGLTSGASPDLSKVASAGTKVLQIDGSVEFATGFAVPNGFTLAVSAGGGLTATADQLSGVVIAGAGSVTVNGLSATADLDGIAVTGSMLVEVLETVTFGGSLGDGFQVVVADGVTLTASAATLDNVFVFGAGNVTLTGVDASVDLSRLLVSGSRSIAVEGTSDLSGAGLADFSLTLVNGAVLTLTADQVAGRTIEGTGTLKITGLGSQTIDDLGATIGDGVSLETTVPVVSITTPIAGDGVVNAAEAASGLVVTGTATDADGQTLTLDFAGVEFSAVVSNGAWSVSVPPTILRAIGDSTYTIEATVSSADGNTGSASTPVVLDASVPGAPSFAAVADNDAINASESGSAVISGTAEANATVELSLGGQVKTLTAGSDGVWSYSVLAADYTAMGQGSETLSAVAIDAAGNRSPVATKVIQIDTVAPSVAITDDEPGVANIAGGDVVFTFTFSEGVTGFTADDVTVSNGSKGAFAQLSATTYSLIVTPTTGFEGNLTVDVAAGAAQDAAGNDSLAAVQRVQAVDTLAPMVTVSALGGADKVVSTLAGDNVVTGSGEAGRNVTLLSSTGAVLGTVRAEATSGTTSGTWSYTLTADNLAVLGQGSDSITARQTDAAGNVGDSTAFAFSVDTVAPSLAINPIAGDDLLVFAEVEEGVVISGTATGVEDGQVVTVSFNGGTYTATVSAGAWSTDAIPVSSLTNGKYSVIANVADAAGNPAQAAARSLTVALEAPAISIEVVAGDDLINIAEAKLSLTLSGTAANVADNTEITVSFNGVDYFDTIQAGNWSVTVPAINLAGLAHGASYTVSASAAGATASRSVSTDLRAPTITVNTVAGDDIINIAEKAAGFVVSGTASAGAEVTLQLGSLERSFTAGADGTWSYRFEPAEVSGFAQGNYVLAASARDAAGNVGTAAQRTIGFDLTAPAAATVALVEDTGANTTDRLTRNGTLSVTGVEQGASDSYSTDGGVTWAAGFTPVEGLNNVKVRVSDTAGNRTVTDFSFTLDTATAAPRVALVTDSGASSTDGMTNVGTLNVSGVETGAVVEYSLDNGSTWSSSFAPVVGVNAVQVRATDLAGNQVTTSFSFTLDISTPAPVVSLTTDSGSSNADRISNVGTLSIEAEADASLAYSIDGGVSWSDSFTAVEGANAVRVRATDLAGNQATSEFSFTLDTVVPALPVITSAELTKVAKPVISGTAEAGSTVTVSVGGAVYGVTANAQGAWSVDLATATPSSGTLVLGDDSFEVSATATDAAGNESAAVTQTLVIDTLAPDEPVITSLPVAGVDFPVISGTAEAGSMVEVSIGGAVYSVTATALGAWSVDLATATPNEGTTLVLGDGTFPVTVIATDAAGNESEAGTQSLVIDTVTPVMNALNAAPSVIQFGAVLVEGADKLGIDLGEFQALDPSVQASVVNDLFVNRPANGYMTPATVDGIFDAVIDVYQALAAAVETANAMTQETPIETLLDVVTAAVDSFGAALNAGAATVAGQSMATAYTSGKAAISSFGALSPVGQQAFVDAIVAGQLYTGFSALLAQSQVAYQLGVAADTVAPVLTLTEDTGTDGDGITANGEVEVTGLLPDATWEYSLDGGANWTAGTGTTFTVPEGVYAAGKVVVQQTNVIGTPSKIGQLGAVTVDETAPATPTINSDVVAVAQVEIELVADAGSLVEIRIGGDLVGSETLASAVDGARTFDVTLQGGDNALVVTVTDLAGNVSTAATKTVFFDPVTPALIAATSAQEVLEALALPEAVGVGYAVGDGSAFKGLSEARQLSVANDLLANSNDTHDTALEAIALFDAVMSVRSAMYTSLDRINAEDSPADINEETIFTDVLDVVKAAVAANVGLVTIGGQLVSTLVTQGDLAVTNYRNLSDRDELAFRQALIDEDFGSITELLNFAVETWTYLDGLDDAALAAINAATTGAEAGVALTSYADRFDIDVSPTSEFSALELARQQAVFADVLANRGNAVFGGSYDTLAQVKTLFDTDVGVRTVMEASLDTINTATTADEISSQTIFTDVLDAVKAAIAADVGLTTISGTLLSALVTQGDAAVLNYNALSEAGQLAFREALIAENFESITELLNFAVQTWTILDGLEDAALAAVNSADATTIAGVLAANADELEIDLTEYAALPTNTQLAVLSDLLMNRPSSGYSSATAVDSVFDAVIDVYQAIGLSLVTANAMTSDTPIASLLQVVGGAVSAFGAAVTAGAESVAGQDMAVVAPSAQAAITSFGTLGTAGQKAFVDAVVAAKDTGYTSFSDLLAASQLAFVEGQQADALAEQAVALAALNAADATTIAGVLAANAEELGIDLGAGSDYANLGAERQTQLMADLLANKAVNFATGFGTVAQVKALFDAGVALRTEIVSVLDTVNAAGPTTPLTDIDFLNDLLVSFGSTSLAEVGFTLITSGTSVYPLAELVTQGQAALAVYNSLPTAEQAALRLAVSSQDYASFSELFLAVSEALPEPPPAELNVVLPQPGEFLSVTSATDLDLQLVSQDNSTATFAVYVAPEFGTINSATLDVVFGAGHVTSIEMLSGPTGYLTTLEEDGVTETGELYPGQDALLFGWNGLTAFDPSLGQALFTFKVGLASPSVAFDISVIPVDLGVKRYDGETADVVATFDPTPTAIAMGTDARDLLIAGPGEVEATGKLDADVFAPTSLDTQLSILDFSGSETGGQGDKVDFGALLAGLGYTSVATQAGAPVTGVVLPWLQATTPPTLDNVFTASGWAHADGVGTLTVAVDANPSAGVIDVQTLQIVIHTQDPLPLALEELGLTLDLAQYNTPA